MQFFSGDYGGGHYAREVGRSYLWGRAVLNIVGSVERAMLYQHALDQHGQAAALIFDSQKMGAAYFQC